MADTSEVTPILTLKHLCEAIKNRVDGSWPKDAYPLTGPYLAQLPQNAGAEGSVWLSYHIVDGHPDDTMNDCGEVISVQFDLWTASAGAVSGAEYMGLLWALFDDFELELSGDSEETIRADRTDYSLLPDPDSRGWHAQTDYSFGITR